MPVRPTPPTEPVGSGSQPGQPVLGGMEARTLLRRMRHELMDAILEEITAEVAFYAGLPEDVIRDEIRPVAQSNLQIFQDALDGRPLTAQARQQLTDSAYRRAEEGFPMEVALKGYLVGARAAFELVSARASSDEIDALRLLTRRLIDHLADVQSVLCAAYLDELRSTSGSEQALRAGLVRALLDDDAVAVEGGALAVGVELAAEYAVVTFEVETGGGRSWSDDLEDRAVPVMARRFLRTVRGVLLDAEPEPLLRLAPSGGVVLLPQRPGSDWTGPRTRALVDRIQDATGAALRAAVATGPRGDLGAAAHLTRELVDLSTALGLPAGTYCLDQLLLEYQLSRPGPGADALRRRMLPLTEHPVMWRTLHAYVGTEHSRPRTAARLSVHPNTVDYRLSRVRDLVGLDATVPSELATLRAGLAVLGAPDPAAS
ncbi:helix-turn-helix domain-containing protein [Nocardioides flavescens]|uniref:Uncharacterized protein n=1 Tax=Nocardioides flavescens TaxID=2691959 RepID=A0A6L7F212_9ACTN|nr:hypothetical protein [Nocardioides flavescens]